MANWEKFFQQGASGALATAKTGNPKLIAGSALLSALPALFEKKRKGFDPRKYRKALELYANAARGGARRAADEAGSTLGSQLASRGLNQSALAPGIITANKARLLGRTEEMIGRNRGALELELAAAQDASDRAAGDESRAGWENLSRAAILLGHNVATKDSKLREWLGLDPVDKTLVSSAPGKPSGLQTPPTDADVHGPFGDARDLLGGKPLTEQEKELGEAASLYDVDVGAAKTPGTDIVDLLRGREEPMHGLGPELTPGGRSEYDEGGRIGRGGVEPSERWGYDEGGMSGLQTPPTDIGELPALDDDVSEEEVGRYLASLGIDENGVAGQYTKEFPPQMDLLYRTLGVERVEELLGGLSRGSLF